MPTPLTHAVVGASFATLLPPTRSRARIALAFGVMAALPDLDGVGFLLGVPYGHPLGHRGFTHSICFAALVAGGMVVASLLPRSPLRERGGRLLLLCFLAVSLHGVLDMMTNGGLGVGLLLPFHDGRLFLPFRPIQVSPIRPARFLSDAAPVLTSELLWIWLPTLIAVICVRSRPLSSTSSSRRSWTRRRDDSKRRDPS